MLPTDTMYGLVGMALNHEAVERIYKLRTRDNTKPMIVLISGWEDLKQLGIKLTPNLRTELELLWPEPVSVILPSRGSSAAHLRREGTTLAVRWPKLKELITLISAVGPLVAPSANVEKKEPATNIREAENYFGERVDFYVDWGERGVVPSTLIKLEKRKRVVLRAGKKRI